MKFTKLHGLGNDFLVVRPDGELDASRAGELARRICERHTGVGADGIVLVGLKDPAGKTAAFRVYNPDGSEAEMCGNGLRCAMAFLVHEGKVSVSSGPVVFDTAAGRRVCEVKNKSGLAYEIRTDMGTPRFGSADIPFDDGQVHEKLVDHPLIIGDKRYGITCVSMGNPHCDVFVDHFPARVEWHATGREIEVHPFFPNRTNVEFIHVLNRGEIEVLFWERGVGETLASGTGSSAAAVASMLRGLTDRTVKVRTNLGSLTVDWSSDGTVFQTGPAEVVCEGDYLG